LNLVEKGPLSDLYSS